MRKRTYFAGIAVWAHALKEAGWGNRPVWTGSCPCQPFSSAGRRGGIADERHLWPAWFDLIRQCRPAAIFGEQVASPDGLAWFDAVRADLEGAGYAVGASDLCAAGTGAPHIRQRLYFVAVAHSKRRHGEHSLLRDQERRGGETSLSETAGSCAAGVLGDASRARGRRNAREISGEKTRSRSERKPVGRVANESESSGANSFGELGDPASRPSDGRLLKRQEPENLGRKPKGTSGQRDASSGNLGTSGFWSPADWLLCQDGRYRPVEPGSFPLVAGATNRVGKLRAYGNAICAPVAITFVKAVMEILGYE